MRNSTLGLSFFWHMHQPDYRGADGVMKMPWVFLHAIKDYYEMPWLVSLHKGLKATFNITPTLIEQLLLYRDPLKNDHFLALWMQEPSQLSESDKNWLIKTCKSTQYETMVKPCRRFNELYRKEKYSDKELIDLEVVFILVWCGNYLRLHNPLIRELMAKQSGFAQSDKARLLETLCGFIAEILPFYASLQEKGVISVSTTPYNHPILPLLIDMHNAVRSNPHTSLPQRMLSLKEDALIHVERSIELYREIFGRAPKGFWPAEGAVDEESVNIYRDHNFKWIATDEAILFKSLGSENRSALYTPYRFGDMTIGFRDHGLSDLIGFTYRFKSGRDAADHFLHALESIHHAHDNPTVLVIVDGENAWEFFENNGFDFFTALYTRLEQTPWCRSVTMDEVADHNDAVALSRLAPGSWIHGTFDTWAGHREKNRAWELIYQTKRDVAHRLEALPADLFEKIRYHFLASECSDWFWWYGDDHATEFGLEFDSLFRNHLIAIYRLLEMAPPSDLLEPIQTHKERESFLIPPQGTISPNIDGKNGSFFDWLGCGRVDERKLYSTMDRVRGPIESIDYGHDEHCVYVALDGNIASLDVDNDTLVISIDESGRKITLALNGTDAIEGVKIAVDERVEFAIARSYFESYKVIHLRFELNRGDTIIQALPGFGSLSIDFEDTCGRNWFI